MSEACNAAPTSEGAVPPGWVRVRRIAGFAAAGTMSLYLAVKVAWVAGTFLGAVPEALDMNTPEWLALNTITVGMAASGVALGLALAQPWGKRLPGSLVILFNWAASGFLVSLLPHSALSALLGATDAEPGGEPDPFPRWESILIMIGFIGMAVGLIVAVPIYMRERWPRAFTGRTAGANVVSTRFLAFTLATTAVPTLLWSYWAIGGTLGLNPDALERWNVDTQLLVGTSAVWAALGAWSAWALSGRARTSLPMWLPMTAGFVASGSLFAWNAWRALWLLIPVTELEPLKLPTVAAVEHCTAMGAGLAVMVILLRAHRNNMSRPGFDGDIEDPEGSGAWLHHGSTRTSCVSGPRGWLCRRGRTRRLGSGR